LIALTGAKGLIASAGRYGGTYTRRDMVFEFGSQLKAAKEGGIVFHSLPLKIAFNATLT